MKVTDIQIYLKQNGINSQLERINEVNQVNKLKVQLPFLASENLVCELLFNPEIDKEFQNAQMLQYFIYLKSDITGINLVDVSRTFNSINSNSLINGFYLNEEENFAYFRYTKILSDNVSVDNFKLIWEDLHLIEFVFKTYYSFVKTILNVVVNERSELKALEDFFNQKNLEATFIEKSEKISTDILQVFIKKDFKQRYRTMNFNFLDFDSVLKHNKILQVNCPMSFDVIPSKFDQIKDFINKINSQSTIGKYTLDENGCVNVTHYFPFLKTEAINLNSLYESLSLMLYAIDQVQPEIEKINDLPVNA